MVGAQEYTAAVTATESSLLCGSCCFSGQGKLDNHIGMMTHQKADSNPHLAQFQLRPKCGTFDWLGKRMSTVCLNLKKLLSFSIDFHWTQIRRGSQNCKKGPNWTLTGKREPAESKILAIDLNFSVVHYFFTSRIIICKGKSMFIFLWHFDNLTNKQLWEGNRLHLPMI